MWQQQCSMFQSHLIKKCHVGSFGTFDFRSASQPKLQQTTSPPARKRIIRLLAALNTLPMEDCSSKRKRAELSIADKKLICQLSQLNPGFTQEVFVAHVRKVLNKGICRSTLSKVLKQKDTWLNTDDSLEGARRQRRPKWEDLEETLYYWVCKVSFRSIHHLVTFIAVPKEHSSCM